ncbi:enhancer of mRNA decapping [Umbelopsis sp. WA50703]
MAQSFLGLRVSLSLNTGLSLEGKVSHIDSSTQLLTLSDVLIFIPGQATQRAPLYGVNGSDIKDLQILPESTSVAPAPTTIANTQQQVQQQQQPQQFPAIPSAQRQTLQAQSSTLQGSPSQTMSHPPPPPSVRPKTIARNDGASGNISKQVVYDARAKKVDESSATESASAIKSKKKKTSRQMQTETNVQQQGNSRKTKTGRKAQAQPVHEWAGGDVNDFKEEEFDFQANLDMFDKAKVFAEIRELDETAPETRLVTLNRLPQQGRGSRTPNNNNGSSPKRVNLLPSENVLDEQIDPGALSDDSLTSEGVDYMRGKRRGSKQSQRSKIVVMSSGILCPVVTSQQITMVEQECDRDQLIENAGRVSSMMAIQTLGGNRRNSDHSAVAAPVVVILAGNNTIGAYGFSAGRHLVNHGCTVIACTGSMPPYQSIVATHQKMFEHAGGLTISSLTQLPNKPIDLIIDALMGAQYNYKNLMHEKKAHQLTSSLISWANANAAPILSLDFPSGNQTSQDCSSQGPHRIHPKWTVCLGAPKFGCTARDVTGELYMGDLGIPRICWKRAGVKGGGMPWGADFLVALEYV